jgi:hypothetical protein
MATTAASGAPAAATANKAELLAIADAVAREKLIDQAIVIEAMEDAIQRAARARYGAENDIRAKLDGTTGDLRLWRVLEVVEEPEDHFKQVDLKGAQKLQKDAAVGDFIVDRCRRSSSAESPHRPPSRSSSRRSATPNASGNMRNSRIVPAKSSPASSSGSSSATSWSTWAGPKALSAATSRSRAKWSASATESVR